MSENIDGALAFRATLDINDFNISASTMEKRIQHVSAVAVNEADRMNSAISKYASTFIGIVGVNKAAEFVNSMVQVRSEMQNTEASFKVFLGSAEKAEAFFKRMQSYAYNNVFEFADLTKNAAQLLAFRTDVNDVIPIIDKLSNIAAGANVNLAELINLFNKTKANDKMLSVDIQMWETRGVPIVYELAQAYGKSEDAIRSMVSEGKIGFSDLNTVITKLTDKGGMFAGMMVEKMKTLGDSIGLLQDNLTTMFNSLGESNQGVLKTGIDTASYLVEHYEDVGRVLGSLVIAYGTYKAALISLSLAAKQGTGITVLDNSVKSIKLSLLKMEEKASGRAAAQISAMTKAEAANTAAMEAQLTTEEKLTLSKNVRIATIGRLLTAQQQEYLANIGLTASSKGYEEAALSILSVEQQEALSKIDLTSKSAIYRSALTQEVAIKKQSNIATLEAMRADVKAAAARVESTKQSAIATQQATEAARYEVYWAKQSGDATRIQVAEKKHLAAIENQSIARKTALAAQTDFHTKKKLLETTATKRGTIANIADNTVTGAQIVKKSLLSTVTTGLIAKMKALWATMMANPITALLSLVGMAVAAFTLFGKKNEEADDAVGEFNETTKKEIDQLNVLKSVLKNTESGTKAHKNALEKVNTILKDYNKELLTESFTVEQLEGKYKELTGAINESAAARIKAKYIEKIHQEESSDLDDAKKDLIKAGERLKKSVTTDSGQYYAAVTPIREMHKSIYDFVEDTAIEAAGRLKDLTGEAYTSAYSELLEEVLLKVKEAAGAGDDDMDAFSSDINKYLTRTIDRARDTRKEIDDLTNSSKLFMEAGEGKSGIEKSVDYANMSFSELDKLAKNTRDEIDKINSKEIKVETDNSRLTELKETLNQVNTAVSGKEASLNTESAISARIKQLKDERENIEINSKEYTKITEKINSLQKNLPDNSKNAAENALKKQEQLDEKQIQADLRLQQARIDVMEDGYDKRKALLDLQHKQNLLDIEKEKKELAKARRDTGGGDLTDKEKKVFSDRVDAENKSYEKANNKLFDGELEYKKKQYELYFRWVKSIGKEAAEKQFEDLLTGGESYKEYVEQQMKVLDKKRIAGTMTEGEGNHLIALKVQYDEITGAKTAIDSFTESFTNAINQASTLAEKIEAISDAKEKLSNGSSGLLGEDEKATARLLINDQERETEKELQNKILNDFQTFEEKKTAIQDEYSLLRNEAVKMGNAELLNEINKGEAEAMSALNAQMLMQTDSWKNLFSDLDALTIDQIDKLITEIQDKMDTADLDLNPSDLKAVLDRLDEAKQKILDVNPFKAMGKAISDVFKKTDQGSKKETVSIKRDWNNLAKATEGTFDFVNDAIDSCEVLGDIIGESGKAAIQTIQGITMAGVAMAAAIQTAEKGSVILLAISIALQAIQWIAGLFNNDAELEEKIQGIQEKVDALSNSFDRLATAMSKTYWEFSDEEQASYEKRIDLINQQIRALEKQSEKAFFGARFGDYKEIVKQIKDLQYQLEKAEQSGDMMDLFQLQKENLKNQQDLIKQQIEAEEDKKKTDYGKILEWEEDIKKIDSQLEELQESMIETLAGTDVKSAIDEFADALVEAYVRGEDSAKALGEVTKNTLKKAVVEGLKRQYLAKGIEEAINYLGSDEVWKDSAVDDRERAEFERLVNKAGDKFNIAIESLGDWIKDVDEASMEDPLTGAIRSLSEETGGVIAGKMNATVINQAESISIMRQALILHQQTAHNTNVSATELKEIKDTLKRIENKDSSLLSQGIS